MDLYNLHENVNNGYVYLEIQKMRVCFSTIRDVTKQEIKGQKGKKWLLRSTPRTSVMETL